VGRNEIAVVLRRRVRHAHALAFEVRLRELISSAATQPGHLHAEVLPAPSLTDRRTTSSSIGSPNPAIDNRR
jgi:antibiotic biosynthesis monooxygenase (ABM) superfamily enzyme